ncbi:MAG TPA: TetR family transcriptional regulator [Acidimicrobiales bacterium]
MTTTDAFPVAKGERRHQTEERILGVARELFSETGYDRTTIRAVAAGAGVDPALVMHYFGSKENLFGAAIRVDMEDVVVGPEEELADRLLAKLEQKLEGEPEAQLALLRSMLTHDQAAEAVRAALRRECGQVVGNAIGGEAGSLRAGVLSAMTVGVMVGRYLLQLEGLKDADPKEIMELLRPCFHSVVDRDAETRKTVRPSRSKPAPEAGPKARPRSKRGRAG